MKSYAQSRKQLISSLANQRQVERCKKILTFLKHHDSTIKIFSDIETFTVDQVYNHHRMTGFWQKTEKKSSGSTGPNIPSKSWSLESWGLMAKSRGGGRLLSTR